MIGKPLLKHLLISILLLVLQQPESNARFYNTLYWMNGIPQSNYGNPALAPQPNFFIGLPVISSVYGNLSNSGFMVDDMYRLDMNDEYYWDSDNLLSQLNENNHLQSSMHIGLLSFGFRHKNRYFHFHAAERIESNMVYSKDIMHLMFEGTANFPSNRLPGNFDNLGTDYYHYREYAAGYLREWSPALSIGIRAKLLTGFSHASFQYQSMRMQTTADGNMELYADILVNSSNNAIPQKLAGTEEQQRSYDAGSDMVRYLTNTGNQGAALDLGLFIKPLPFASFALSVLDLGFINWKDHAENLHIEGFSQFTGTDIQYMFAGNIIDNFNQHADTASYGYPTSQTTEAYRQVLAPRLYASAAFDLGPRHQLSLLANGLYYNDIIYPSASLAYRAKPSHAVNIIMSYTVANHSYSNIGFGFNLNMGPIQLYALSDNILAPILPNKAKMANMHVGMNLVFGYRPQSDQPRQ